MIWQMCNIQEDKGAQRCVKVGHNVIVESTLSHFFFQPGDESQNYDH